MASSKGITVYYDFESALGVNASCVDWDCRNMFFESWNEFTTFLFVEHAGNFELVEITKENYTELCEMGVFNEA